MTLGFDELKSRLKPSERPILERYLLEEEKTIEQTITNEITTDAEHVDIVNHCLYAFTQSGPAKDTGFHFIRVEPLFSFEEAPRFDLLIHNPEQQSSILIECKSSVSSPKTALEQVEKASVFAKDHLRELQSEIGYAIKSMEFVICSPAHDADSLVDELRKNEQPVIVWSFDKFKDTIKLRKPSEDNDSNIKLGRLHRNEVLRKMLFETIESSSRVIHFMPSSHMCRILQEVIIGLQHDKFERDLEAKHEFTLSDIETALRRGLLNFEPEETSRLARKVLASGISTGVFQVEDKDDHDASKWTLKIPFDTRGPEHIIKSVKNYYVRYKQAREAKNQAVEKYEAYARSRPDRLQIS